MTFGDRFLWAMDCENPVTKRFTSGFHIPVWHDRPVPTMPPMDDKSRRQESRRLIRNNNEKSINSSLGSVPRRPKRWSTEQLGGWRNGQGDVWDCLLSRRLRLDGPEKSSPAVKCHSIHLDGGGGLIEFQRLSDLIHVMSSVCQPESFLF